MDPFSKEAIAKRKANYPINPLILGRWSPRAMNGEAMSDEELFPIFEAARWAPSSFNEQPWHLLYAKRDTPQWDTFFNLLIDFNKAWCKNAAVLLVFVSSNLFEKGAKYSPTHSYDTGAAWMALALEGVQRGYVVHGMSGFDYEKAKLKLHVPENYTVEAMAAIGKKAPKEILEAKIQEMETPSSRKPLDQIIHEGAF